MTLRLAGAGAEPWPRVRCVRDPRFNKRRAEARRLFLVFSVARGWRGDNLK